MNKIKYAKRSIALLSVFLIIFGALLWRLMVITMNEAGSLSTLLSSQYSNTVRTADLNYIIFDKNGKQMLNYNNEYHVVIDPEAFKKNYNNEGDVFALTYILKNNVPSHNLIDIGLGKSSARQDFSDINESTYKKLQNIKGVKGFYTYISHVVDRTEAWKIENMISDIKNSNNQNKQETSLEMQVFQRTKNNQYPKQIFTKDLDGNITGSETKISDSNVNIRLTLDKNIQDRIKAIITSEKYSKYNQVGVVVMESNTGKLLSMTQKDETQPNVNLGSTVQGFEPGSIFKVIVEEAGLDRKTISLNEMYTCGSGIYSGIYDLCPDHHHGTLNVENALRVSCNNIFAQIGDKVGINNFIDNAQQQGLFKKVLNFDTEAAGDMAEVKQGEGAGQFAIGQSMTITPIQAISIANTIINDGYYIKPYIIDALVDNNAKEVGIIKTEKHPAINKSTASILKNQMISVVNNGTGKAAALPNIQVGGKTGTSTRYDSDAKVNTSDGWFIGFFKIDNKYYSMVVYVKDINPESEQAASTAAPIFKDIVLSLNNYFLK